MKKIFGLVLSAVITLMLFWVDVQAATVVNTEEELREALKAGGDIVLGSDITMTRSIYAEESFSLDMNGHDIIFGVWFDSGTYIAILEFDATVKITDSVGGGSFKSENADKRGVLCLEVDKSEIIGVDIPEIRYFRGDNSITDSTIEYIECVDDYHFLKMNLYGNVTVGEMFIDGGTYNFDPSKILHTGLTAVNNKNGTYTVGCICVEASGETQTMYFDNYIDEEGKYYYSKSITKNKSAEELVVRIRYATGNSISCYYYEMTPVDDEGKLWCTEIDTAYINAIADIFSNDGLSEYLMVVIPGEDESIIDYKGNVTIREVVEPETPSAKEEESTSEEQTESSPDVVITETEKETLEQTEKEPKVPNEDLPYIIGVVIFGIVVIVSILAITIHKKKQENSL